LPQHLLSGLMYRLARCSWKPVKDLLIRFALQRYKIDLTQAADPVPANYPSFNAFFTRALRPDARPIAAGPDAIVSPADGRISQFGRIRDHQLLQAKGREYRLWDLLAGREELVAPFRDGHFITIYLSPRDYHRVHMPFAGRLTAMYFVPGRLLSVNDATAALVPDLFARNERLLCHFETPRGPMIVILVGAIFVGSMETVWEGEVREPARQVSIRDYATHDPIDLAKGAEMGRFNMGSTVILLLPPGAADWRDDLTAGGTLRMGEQIGRFRPD